MIEIKTMSILYEAFQAAKSGEKIKALKMADHYALETARWLPLWHSLDILTHIAPLGTLYEELGEWELAALKHEDICAYAELYAPNTTETAGDYRHLCEMLEKLGEHQKAYEALEASIRHIKGAGRWDDFSEYYTEKLAQLNQRLSNNNNCMTKPDKIDPFWKDIGETCVRQVKRMIDYFHLHGGDHMDWAQPRFEALIKNEVVEKLIKEASNILSLSPDRGKILEPISFTDNWFIVLSVYPKDDKEGFLKKCPNGSYEQLARISRDLFRDFDESWGSMNYAHWILLVDIAEGKASVHLHTIWSFNSILDWVIESKEKNNIVKIAPTIIPIELCRENREEFTNQLIKDDVIAYQKQKENKPSPD